MPVDEEALRRGEEVVGWSAKKAGKKKRQKFVGTLATKESLENGFRVSVMPFPSSDRHFTRSSQISL